MAAEKMLLSVGDDRPTFAVSRCNFPDPVAAAILWAEDFLEPLESMHDNTDEEMQDYNDGETYGYRGNAKTAKARFVAAIAAWARDNVKATWFNADADEMEEIRR
jgi:hypothetical protein